MDNAIGIALFAATCGALDYARGRKWSKLMAVVMGLWIGGWMAYFTGMSEWFAAAFGVLFGIGAIPGWGHPIGRALGGENKVEPEAWQFHQILVTSIPLALTTRGLMWALPTVALAYWNTTVLYGLLIIPLAFMVAPFIARDVFRPTIERWKKMEMIRGVLIGLGYGLALTYG